MWVFMFMFMLMLMCMRPCHVSVCVRPYIIDLNSTNGTFVCGKRIESARYIELLEKDVIRFGESTREYVLLHTEVLTDEEVASERREDQAKAQAKRKA